MKIDDTVFFKRHPGLPFIEMRRASGSSACYHPHSHEEFSFGVIDAGSADYVNRDCSYVINVGDTVTINPGDVHSCNPREGKWSYRMLFIDSNWIRTLQSEMLDQVLTDYRPFVNHFETSADYFHDFDHLFKQLVNHDDVLKAESLLISFLERCFHAERSEVAPFTIAHDSKRLETVKALITEQLEDNFSLDQLAQHSGLSRYHFLRCFKQVYGLSPHAFLLDKRIEKAKKMLQAGTGILDTSLALGFNDQSHFQRHFKKRLAVTPRQYQDFFI